MAHLPIIGEVQRCLHARISHNRAVIIIITIITTIIIRAVITVVQAKAVLRSRRVAEEVVSVRQAVEELPVPVEAEVAVDGKVMEIDE